MAFTPLELASFKATGATTSRTTQDHYGDVVNVKDYGALGNNSADDYPAIQLAFDTAFGPAATPNGLVNSSKNRPVFFPDGKYLCLSGVPTLTRVVGGHIYGTGGGGAVAIFGLSGSNALNINGASGLVIEQMNFTGGGQTSGVGIDLNWDGATDSNGNDGLHNNFIRDVGIGAAATGIRIANGGFDGASNCFQNCDIGNVTNGIVAASATAINNMALRCSFSGTLANCVWSSLGSIHCFGLDLERDAPPSGGVTGFTLSISGSTATFSGSLSGIIGRQLWAAGLPTGDSAPTILSGSGTTWTLSGSFGSLSPGTNWLLGLSGFDVLVDSGLPVTVFGARSESSRCLGVSSGFVTAHAIECAGSAEIVNMRAKATLTAKIDNGSGSAGTTLTVTAASGSSLAIGDVITWSGATAPLTRITAFGSGSGGTGTYTVNNSLNVASTSMSAGGSASMDSCISTNGGFGLINGVAGGLYFRGCQTGSTSGFSGVFGQNI